MDQGQSRCIYSTVLPGMTAIAGLFWRAKRDEPKEFKNRLTKLGLFLVITTIVGVLINFYSQYNTFATNESEKKQSDSIQNLRYTLLQSSSTQTVIGLRQQRSLDSNQIIADSQRFNITLGKFGEQLITQNEALFNINKVLHPLFPLHIYCKIEIQLDSLKENHLLYENLLEIAKGKIKLSRGVYIIGSTPNSHIAYEQTRLKYLEVSNGVLMDSLMKILVPRISIFIQDFKYPPGNSLNLLFLISAEKEGEEYSYHFDYASKIITLNIFAQLLPESGTIDKILTLGEAKDGLLEVSIFSSEIKPSFDMKSFNFYCGNTFYSSYKIFIYRRQC
ncbi:MAG: hypothetical protein ABJA35_11780 [Parafilimonas sp.]